MDQNTDQNTDYLKLYNEAKQSLEETLTLNAELIQMNKKMSEQNIEAIKALRKTEEDFVRLEKVRNKGIFFEYRNKDMFYVPVLGDIEFFKQKKEIPIRLLYTFKFKDIEDWIKDVHDIMGRNNSKIHKIKEEDLL